MNQEVINQLDSWLYDPYPADMQALNYYWENIFHCEDSITKTSDVFRTFFQSFARIGVKSLKTSATQGGERQKCQIGKVGDIQEVTLLNQHDQFAGLLVLYDVEYSTNNGDKQVITLESWLAPLSHEELLNLNMSNGPQRLVGLEVSNSKLYRLGLFILFILFRLCHMFQFCYRLIIFFCRNCQLYNLRLLRVRSFFNNCRSG